MKNRTKQSYGWSAVVAIVWLGITMCLSAYALLKPRTTSEDLGFVPGFLARWLDENYDFRTFLMTLAVTTVPAILMASKSRTALRRLALTLVIVALSAMECAQYWIPTRGFGMPDLIYTLAGGGFSEGFATIWTVFFLKDSTQAQ